jgi:F-type H+-transporting ATPase subunit gamma
VTESTISLRRKIDSCNDLQSVVRTMKAMAAASIGQYERSVLALGDYYRTVELGLGTCLRQLGPDALRTAEKGTNEEQRTGAIVFGSDQGLVGRFNELVVDFAVQTLPAIPGPAQIWVVGERAQALLDDADRAPEGTWPVPGSIQTIGPLVRELLVKSAALHDQGRLTELHLFYNRPAAGTGYAPVRQRLLPLDGAWLRQSLDIEWPTDKLAEVLGHRVATLRALVHEYLFISLFRACAESLASENASRLAAMERADKNIDELRDGFEEAFRRLRQSGIDEELFDVVFGFEALTDRPPVRPAERRATSS